MGLVNDKFSLHKQADLSYWIGHSNTCIEIPRKMCSPNLIVHFGSRALAVPVTGVSLRWQDSSLSRRVARGPAALSFKCPLVYTGFRDCLRKDEGRGAPQ